MTELYDFNTRPSAITIRCPICGAAAVFQSPFTFLGRSQSDATTIGTAQRNPNIEVVKWGNCHVLVHFPNIFPWDSPSADKSYRTPNSGVSLCFQCGYKVKHILSWPDDAYFVCEFKVHVLWAWTRGHAQELKSFVDSKDRDPWNHPGYVMYLLHTPGVFLLAKNREAVSKELQRMLRL
jgi:hypothetical protein